MATAFRPHNRQREVKSAADFTFSFSFVEKVPMEGLFDLSRRLAARSLDTQIKILKQMKKIIYN
jgi:hypothetical protein